MLKSQQNKNGLKGELLNSNILDHGKIKYKEIDDVNKIHKAINMSGNKGGFFSDELKKLIKQDWENHCKFFVGLLFASCVVATFLFCIFVLSGLFTFLSEKNPSFIGFFKVLDFGMVIEFKETIINESVVNKSISIPKEAVSVILMFMGIFIFRIRIIRKINSLIKSFIKKDSS